MLKSEFMISQRMLVLMYVINLAADIWSVENVAAGKFSSL